jgi:hypothetical protein|nr:MAG TPA: hypothetical protein [Caudoviricetes sp.]
MKKLHVKATFIEPVLGTWPANPNVAREFIASKSPDAATIEDEVAALGPDAVADKGMTVFPRDPDGNPIFYDYQIKGMFKDACGMLSRIGGKTETGKKKAVNESGKLTAYKKVIDGLIFVQPPHDSDSGKRRDRRMPAPAARPDRTGRAREPCQQ